jgi:hypothetical protein
MDGVSYYAIVRDGTDPEAATGLLRTRSTGEGREDESLRDDMSWQPSSALFEWETGDVSGRELIEISEPQAEKLIDGFRAKWKKPG